jgi:hypothetical protein
MKIKLPLIILMFLLFAGCERKHDPLTLKNNANPVITAMSANPQSVESLSMSNITVSAEDPDGDTLAYSWASSSGSVAGVGTSVIWTAPADTGTYTVSVSVSDGKDGLASRSVSILVSTSAPQSLQNRAPVISTMTATPGILVSPLYYPVTSYISVEAVDPDGDSLNYSWSYTRNDIPALVPIDGNTPSILWEVGIQCHPIIYTIAVTVSDGKGGESSSSVSVLVYGGTPGP